MNWLLLTLSVSLSTGRNLPSTLLSLLLFRERLTRRIGAVIALGILAIVLINFPA